MSTIKVSVMAPTRAMLEADPTGETWVEIKPPTWTEETIREGLRAKRTHYFDKDGQWRTQTELNLNTLWLWEIWLTYVNTNMEVEVGDVTIVFLPKTKMTQADFFDHLTKCGGDIINEWHQKVVEVVQDWRYPFL